jgi:hypothetical protein
MEQCSETLAYKIQTRLGITQNKAYNIQNTAKVWNRWWTILQQPPRKNFTLGFFIQVLTDLPTSSESYRCPTKIFLHFLAEDGSRVAPSLDCREGAVGLSDTLHRLKLLHGGAARCEAPQCCQVAATCYFLCFRTRLVLECSDMERVRWRFSRAQGNPPNYSICDTIKL